ncbi:MAG: hypothetical protein ACD_56C00049G0006 [uncultured bacterium]|nr:MAG: hypothetical protein ACD_56C00049G0006 [uncultured bacterium]
MRMIMNKNKKIVIFSLVALALIAVVFQLRKNIFLEEGSTKVSIGGHEFRAELAETAMQRKKGLGGRDELCRRCAMLFKFPKPARYNFWMKDMNFPLDIIWVADGKIAHIEKNIQADFAGILKPSTDCSQVVEVNAGTVDKLELKNGDPIDF